MLRAIKAGRNNKCRKGTDLKKPTLILLLTLIAAIPETQASARSTPYVIPPTGNRVAELKRLETFLLNQFNPEVGLVRESPDSSILPTYWLLSDNLLASLALCNYYPDKAKAINATLMTVSYTHLTLPTNREV